MYENHHDVLPFANEDINIIFSDNHSHLDLRRLNEMIYNPFNEIDNDTDDPDYFLTNTRGINIPPSEYIFQSRITPQTNNCLNCSY